MKKQYGKQYGSLYVWSKKGFTLLELLVVAVILGLLSVVIAQIFFTTIRTNNKTEITRGVKESGDRALDIMTRLVQNAKLIDIPSASCPEYPALGSPLSSISLTNFDGGETTLLCKEDDGIAQIASVSASALQTVYLTNTDVSLSDGSTNTCANTLSFTCSSQGDIPSFITIAFSIRQSNSAAALIDSASGMFQTTVTLRNK